MEKKLLTELNRMFQLMGVEKTLLNEDKHDVLKNKYVGEDRRKISPEQFEKFYEAALSNPLLMKYADPLLYLASNDMSKDRFFADQDYLTMADENGILRKYVNKLPVIKIENPEYVNMINFRTIDGFKEYMSKFGKPESETEQIPSKFNELDEAKLKEAGIIKIGVVDDYVVYEISKQNIKDLREAYNRYRNIICAGRTHLCTASNFDHFKNYLDRDPLYLFVNPDDEKAPYQFHYKDQQFMNKDDVSII